MPLVLCETHGAVRVFALNRPKERNALNAALIQTLSDTFEETRHDPNVRAIVLTGTGAAFCAGLDLGELRQVASQDFETNRQDSARFLALLSGMHTFPKPIVAAINGPAVAGGAGLMLASDVAIAHPQARIGFTETRIGFVAAMVAVLLLRQTSEKHARGLLLRAHLIAAHEAQSIGLVNELHDNPISRALEVATQMAENAPNALALTKTWLSRIAGQSIQEALQEASELNAQARSSQELKEGIAAFLEKRSPNWRQV